MAEDFIFTQGEPVQVGTHGEHDYMFAGGEPVPDTGRSDIVFESGTGLGGEAAEVTISDSQGESVGDVAVIARNETIENYYGYAESGNSSSAEGNINEYVELRKTTFFVYENTSTGEYSFGFCHDEWRPDNLDTGGEIDWSVDGLPSATSMVVRDDNPGNDVYTLNPPSASIDQQWASSHTDFRVRPVFSCSDPRPSAGPFPTVDQIELSTA